MRNMRCAFVFIATAIDVRPAMFVGKPWPVISFHVSPSSVDLKSIVPVGPCCAPRRPLPPPPRWAPGAV
jgi:hypothetical protein